MEILTATTHRLAKAKSVKLSELAGEEWITWQAGFCHDWLLHTLRKEGHEPKAHTAAEFAT